MEHPLISIVLDESLRWTISIENWLFIVLIAIVLIVLGSALYVIIFRQNIFGQILGGGLIINEAELGIGNQKIKLKRDHTDLQIAYKLWVELNTRKIGVKIDRENDVIIEIYNSWYSFFTVARELTKDIPVAKLNREHTRNIVELSLKVLNIGIRPHLTRWQAKYRRWHDQAKVDNLEMSPQEFQQTYAHYNELIEDMISVNKNLIKYKEKLRELVMNT
ncbi:MAG: hypothetical protein QF449_05075 [Alphaproteobacteria bacterium]|jgi:hypothetical protein|nr:hypothetical protein [Alphaproteobacteria bacterium]